MINYLCKQRRRPYREIDRRIVTPITVGPALGRRVCRRGLLRDPSLSPASPFTFRFARGIEDWSSPGEPDTARTLVLCERWISTAIVKRAYTEIRRFKVFKNYAISLSTDSLSPTFIWWECWFGIGKFAVPVSASRRKVSRWIFLPDLLARWNTTFSWIYLSIVMLTFSM